jgi:transitional endoplasmic reticulum ATPase
MEHSIYRGHAVYGNMEYFDVDQVDPSRFVYDEDVWAQVETNILSPMRHAQVLESYGLSPKRVVLLEGPFGTGKSALGRTAAKVAVANGWTAITARPGVDDPFLMLQTARLYQPTMLFIEDVDIFSATQNPEQVSMLLDRFDGFGNKDIRMLLVLTTNHADRIHKGMLRPGRLDAVIHIGNMDRPGVEKLCHIIVGHNLDENIDYDAVFAATSDFTPAFVKEAIERAMRYTIARTGKPGQINGDDLIHACNSLRAQLGLQEAAADSHEKLPPLDQQFREMIAQATGVDLNQLGAVTQRSVQRAMHGAALIQESNGKVSHRMHTS